MGRASSSKQVARAAGWDKKSRNLAWPLALAAVVVLGSAGTVTGDVPEQDEAPEGDTPEGDTTATTSP